MDELTDVNRARRLELDYMQTEQALDRHGIRNTIVVFGSTRTPEPEIARRKEAAARTALAGEPESPGLRRRVRIAERLVAKSHYYNVAREFGRLVGRADSRVVIMTGGGPGIMEAANRGAHDVGAKSVGLNITLPHEQAPNPYISPELCFSFHYFAMRKLHFMLRARALVAFPGGYGTLDELFETLTLMQASRLDPVPVMLVGEAFWRRLIDFDFMLEEGVIDERDLQLFRFAETAPEIWDSIRNWYRERGAPLDATVFPRR
jgi:uncharacterized protein (TIGR00730 family)